MTLQKNRHVIPFLLFIVLTTAFTCKKDDGNSSHPAISNCDNLITDTSGTNDQAYVSIGNAFTPNGDGINDSYAPAFRSVASFEFTVYDVSNAVVFTTTEFGKAWKPATQPSGNPTFFYRVQAVTKEHHHIGICGEVHLLTCMPHNSAGQFYFNDQLAPNGTFSLPTQEKLPECP